jgi:hypothetical protein
MQAKKVESKFCDQKPKEIPNEFPFYFEIAEGEKTVKYGFLKRKKKKVKYDYLKFIPGNYELEACDETLGVYVNDYAIKIKPEANRLIKYYKDKEKRK